MLPFPSNSTRPRDALLFNSSPVTPEMTIVESKVMSVEMTTMVSSFVTLLVSCSKSVSSRQEQLSTE